MTLVCREPTEEAPCKKACPAGVDVPRYLSFIARGMFDQALAVIHEKLPFALVCGYVCPHPCETACHLQSVGESLAIRGLKRFVAEHGNDSMAFRPKIMKHTGKKVAVIGSGPAGLTAGYYLARFGHSVTILEALPAPGGMLRVGIPEYRLPRTVLESEIERIRNVGVEIFTNRRIESIESLFSEGYDAILVSVGATQGATIEIAPPELSGLYMGTSFLRDLNLGKSIKTGVTVVVLGGGNVACDCARSAIRMGAKAVHMLCLEPRGGMPASEEEIEQCQDEGIVLHPSTFCTEVHGNGGNVEGIVCQTVRDFRFNEEKAYIDYVEGTASFLEAETVILAIGQVPELKWLGDLPGVRISKRGTLQADEDTLCIGPQGVFAAGDALTGTKSVAEAVAGGRKAAVAIDRYLGGEGIIAEESDWGESDDKETGGGVKLSRKVRPTLLPPGERRSGFSLVEVSFGDEKSVVEEARRCLKANLPIYYDSRLCADCHSCEIACSAIHEGTFNIHKARLRVVGEKDASPDYKVVFLDNCVNCGFCVKSCPYGALTHRNQDTIAESIGDKP